ncbi:MAG: hypothetical protein ABI681_14565 [Gemmatimonadales bacterium]
MGASSIAVGEPAHRAPTMIASYSFVMTASDSRQEKARMLPTQHPGLLPSARRGAAAGAR